MHRADGAHLHARAEAAVKLSYIATEAPTMTSDGSGEWFPLPDQEDSRPSGDDAWQDRIDSLLPADPDTGVVTSEAFRVYLGGSIDLMARHGQPLTLLAIAPDPGDRLRNLGAEEARLIGA